ncbi:DUF6520 family protein [Allomuricauda sp. F6463D]|uniref:DUF6520 family protein n=1 Tax=Allomuricauda sp. F6463D TaxID=2926409 RepID=UPI001FF68996|nr:DUF6520 family protein [Muricauda sp. F6463D]MCK0159048.1 DUF6520 family protein [Muricauda sp. F6463D]
MKTSFLKIVLPALAIVLAVGLAFATEDKSVDREAFYNVTGQGWQSTMVEESCYAGGTIPCKIGTYQLYAEPDFGSTPLHKD